MPAGRNVLAQVLTRISPGKGLAGIISYPPGLSPLKEEQPALLMLVHAGSGVVAPYGHNREGQIMLQHLGHQRKLALPQRPAQVPRESMLEAELLLTSGCEKSILQRSQLYVHVEAPNMALKEKVCNPVGLL